MAEQNLDLDLGRVVVADAVNDSDDARETWRTAACQAVVIATGVATDGHREVLGFAAGDSEDGAFWTAFLRSRKARGLAGTQLVISGAHAGLQVAIGTVLLGTSWQRCRAHSMRNVLAPVPKGNSEMVAAGIRTVFAQPDVQHARGQLDVIAAMLGRRFPAVETMLRDARKDPLAFTSFPQTHSKKIWSTNPLERLNKEIKRRTDVIGVFKATQALEPPTGPGDPGPGVRSGWQGRRC